MNTLHYDSLLSAIYAKCCNQDQIVECRHAGVFMESVVKLNAVMLKVNLPKFVRLNVVMVIVF